mmetsp:Transcript_11224/g.20077  ORF Transcript_11224/g.20077 Transcript_11224/m.20077 type:complete len:191 (-) Transcript_11224:44-616(-)
MDPETHPDPVSVIMSWRPVHPRHYLTQHIGRLQYQACLLTRDAEGVAAASRLREGSWRVLREAPQRDWALALENLGDALLLPAGDEDAEALPESQLQEAHSSFQSSLQMMSRVDGPDSPYSSCISRKLAKTQVLLQSRGLFQDATECSSCNFCGLPGENLPRCSNCRLVAYCCPGHQKLQWRLHKSRCCA